VERKPQFRSDGVQHATINGHRFHLRRKDPTKDNFLWIDGRQPPIVLDRTAPSSSRTHRRHVAPSAGGRGRVAGGDRLRRGQDGGGARGERIPAAAENRKRSHPRRPEPALWNPDGRRRGRLPAEAGLGAKELRYGEWAAPARMDLAITYRCNLKCPKCYVGEKSVERELSTAEWVAVFGRLWAAGVPQVVFTGGEPTLRDDLVELVGQADEFVTGLVTNGTKLAALARPLREASLDYVQVTIESYDPKIHDAITCTTDPTQ